ncbi:MAG: hypothetical protein WDZ35_07080 [Crocinitomicaceae bacterium]
MIQIILALLFFTSCNQKKSEKEHAFEFTQQIVKTYFDNDCKTNYDLWADSVIVMGLLEPDESTIKFVDRFPTSKDWCEKFSSKDRYRVGYTYEEYLNEYDLRIYNFSEFTDKNLMREKREDRAITDYLNEYQSYFGENDYFFVGYHLKEGLTEDKISHSRSWVMIISKTVDGWKISGTLP